MGCFSGRLMSSASDQKLFCNLSSPFSCSFDEFVEEKVISPSYSSAILIPPPEYCGFNSFFVILQSCFTLPARSIQLHQVKAIGFLFYKFIFIYLFGVVLGLRCCSGYSLVAVRGLFIAGLLLLQTLSSGMWASIAAAHGI